MKKLIAALLLGTVLFSAAANAKEDKSKRPSPPAKVETTLANGTKVSIDYSRPSVKGRTIGKDLEPTPGKVWRTGANEATVFEVSKNVMINGKPLPAGKYGLYSVTDGDDFTFIFNKTWNQWGTEYSEGEDALRIKVKKGKGTPFAEKMTFTVDKSGKVTLLWGDLKVDFMVK